MTRDGTLVSDFATRGDGFCFRRSALRLRDGECACAFEIDTSPTVSASDRAGPAPRVSYSKSSHTSAFGGHTNATPPLSVALPLLPSALDPSPPEDEDEDELEEDEASLPLL